MSELVADCRDAARLAAFWCEVLGFVELERVEGSIEIGPPGTGFGGLQPTIVLTPARIPGPAKLRLHFDVSSSSCRTMVAGGMGSGWANTFSSV